MTRKDPIRLTDVEVPELSETLQAAQARLPDEAALQRIASNLEGLLPSTPPPTSPPPGGAPVSWGVLAKPAVIGAVVVASVMAGIFALRQDEARRGSLAQPTDMASRSPARLPAPPAPPAPTIARKAPLAIENEAAASRSEAKTTAREDARPAPAPAVTELELIAKAERLLRSRPGETVRIAEQHARLFPRGRLAQEREVLMIEALAGSGQQARARARAAAFQRSYPTSPHARRIARTLRPLE